MRAMFVFLMALAASATAAAQGAPGAADPHAGHRAPAAAAAADAELVDGEVRRVDRDAKKITLSHGELKSLDMPPMTMVFRVTDPAMLERVKAGDKVRFAVARVGGQFTLTRIERVD